MKKLLLVLMAAGAVVALRPVVQRRIGPKMREHCERMMSHCAGGSEAAGHEAMRQKMREHCEQMAAEHEPPAVLAGSRPV